MASCDNSVMTSCDNSVMTSCDEHSNNIVENQNIFEDTLTKFVVNQEDHLDIKNIILYIQKINRTKKHFADMIAFKTIVVVISKEQEIDRF